ncbi:hypothetical protein A3734_19370 [Sulfitobacter sp. HI0054]|uniref:hypothetical protein n=1 Tax=Sulfitobacter sp. HI0054 TaxID=1822238 RepID=UPI0007C25E77|nr:hypothetical protein [Sulfitobacter sp. HI0054]KZY52306.1 hypothetical protein A3734_19370 [Sulfitobacter sp. HI0054]
MLHFINSIEPEAWAGIAGLVAGIVSAVLAVRKGAKKSPIEVGHAAPPPDRTEYVLTEVRQIAARLAEIEVHMADVDRRTEAIHLDTRILLDRSN